MALSKLEIQRLLWLRGEISFKLHKAQKEMAEIFHKAEPNSTMVFLLSRQLGKSYELVILAIEQCLKKPNSLVGLLTDTKNHIKSIVEPLFVQILEDCPEEIRPVYVPSMYEYRFKNGSKVRMAGSDNKSYDRLRGLKLDLCLVDEAGFIDNLDDIIQSVLIPTTTHTGGKIVLASTPPTDSDHHFHKYIEEAEFSNSLVKKTIYDNPLLTKEQIDNIIKKMGGVNSVRFRREYLVEIIRDEDSVIFPEFTDELEKEICIEWEKPAYFQSYTSMDLGYNDLTAVLFGYYDFRENKVIIEDELIVKGKDLKLPIFTQRIIDKEKELWTNPLTAEFSKPYLRVSDINYIVTEEMYRVSNYQLLFQATKKDDKPAAINQVRVMLSEKRLMISPKCVTLIRHLKHCKWRTKNEKTKFARTPDDGHADAVDALIYFVRSIVYSKNPYPNGGLSGANVFYTKKPPSYQQENNQIDVLKRLFGKK
jgi:hypothetical protein